jgi:hypothetical protein
MTLRCWSCGESLQQLSLPFGRRDQCPVCVNYLHVCRMCRFFDPAVARACREDDAEDVTEKARLNFCDYFRPSEQAFDPLRSAVAEQSARELDVLFGGATDPAKAPSGDSPHADAESLFAKD